MQFGLTSHFKKLGNFTFNLCSIISLVSCEGESKLKLLKCMYTFRVFFTDCLNPLTIKRGTVSYFFQNLLQILFTASSPCQQQLKYSASEMPSVGFLCLCFLKVRGKVHTWDFSICSLNKDALRNIYLLITGTKGHWWRLKPLKAENSKSSIRCLPACPRTCTCLHMCICA